MRQNTSWIDPLVDGRLVRDIIAYSAQVRKGNHRCPAMQCPHCGQRADSPQRFRKHAFRHRTFLVIRDRCVEVVQCMLVRWRCPVCGRTFTEYPPFAAPHKRYVLPQMTCRALRYVEDDGVSYRKGVLHRFLPVFHVGDPSWPLDLRSRFEVRSEPSTLAHSSLHRWISTLGAAGADARGRNKPSGRRSTFLPADWKFATPARRDVLIACRHRCRGGTVALQ